LARHRGSAALAAAASLRVGADADALANPDRARPQHASQLARFRQVEPLMRPQCEVFVIAGERACRVTGSASVRPGEPMAATSVEPRRVAWVRRRKPIIGIRPGGRLLRILPGCADARREVQQLVPATLADGSERDRIPGQL